MENHAPVTFINLPILMINLKYKSCPYDYKSDLFEDSEKLYCCHGGPTDPGVSFAVSCDVHLCGKKDGLCSSNGLPFIGDCCVDDVCHGEETVDNCFLDCALGDSCLAKDELCYGREDECCSDFVTYPMRESMYVCKLIRTLLLLLYV